MSGADPAGDSGGKIPVGISSCLLGQEVRYDGGHKHDRYITDTLGEYFEFRPLCPEAAIGLGIPRPPIRLVGDPENPRVVGVQNPDFDVTERLRDYSRDQAPRLGGLCGYIFKRASPSCGMERVKVYRPDGKGSEKTGVGLFAAAVSRAWPLLPMEEEGRLGDPGLRENFIGRVFVYHRWCGLLNEGLSPARLVEFHTDHKYLVLAHNQAAYRRLGRLVAEAGRRPLEELAADYGSELMTALKRRATRRSNVNVLQHIAGYLKRDLDADDRRELSELIGDYGRGLVPLVVPITLLNHFFRRHPNPYIARQRFLHPHPRELMLRNLL